MFVSTITLISLVAITSAFQVPPSGPGFHPGCVPGWPQHGQCYSSFSYTAETTTRYATGVPRPTPTTTFAPPYTKLSTLLPSNLTYTTYSLNQSATDTGKYGQSAYAALWKPITYSNTALPFTTTVSPTPVPTQSLFFPPAQYEPCPGSSACVDAYRLSEDFIWGLASSAWQFEGGLMSDGRGPSVLDRIGALPQPAQNPQQDAVVADMHYWLYKQDIARMAAIGVRAFGFSISWTRVIPFGTAGSPINQAALDHYQDVIDTCLSYGITPQVTLSHGDQPLDLPFSDEAFAESFLYYAKVVMARFSDKVPHWVTLNEPNTSYGPYSAIRNILMAHAKVAHFYREEIGGKGTITIKFANNIAIPRDVGNPEDVKAALRYQDFLLGIMGRPFFLGENYPESVLSTTGLDLQPLSPEDLAYINGTVDYFSVDPYNAWFAYPPPNGIEACASNPKDPNWPMCVLNTNVGTGDWISGAESFQFAYMTPQYFRQALGYIWNTFRPKGIMITEFGFNPFMEYAEDLNGNRFDFVRAQYYYGYLREMLKAIYEDGVNVIGALAWAMADNNEFGTYKQQYGLQWVNRSSPTLERTYRASLFYFVDFFQKHQQGKW